MVVEQPHAYAVPSDNVEKPAAAPPPPSGTETASLQAFADPQRAQSDALQATDRSDRQRWAVSQTGVDPNRLPPGAGTAAQTDDYRRAIGVRLEARGYTVK
jgi:hypothetical protein